MRYIIGDVHGELEKLERLFSFIESIDNSPSFIFIGDYLDKGPDSKGTLDFLINLNKQHDCVFLIGNHEYCWINASSYEDYLLKYGGLNTVRSFSCNTVKETQEILLSDYGQFFSSLVSYHIIGSYFICHSGVPAEHYLTEYLDIIDQSAFLFNRYEFLKMEALFQNRYIVIFGHTGFYQPFTDNYKIGIDTAACYLKEQPLTCFCPEKEVFFNSHFQTYTLNSLKGDYCSNIIRLKKY